MQIYQIVCYVNALNKQTGQYEDVYRRIRNIYIGNTGLSTARNDYEKLHELFKQQISDVDKNKHDDVVGKCELNEPDMLTDGAVATWGKNVLFSDCVNCSQ